MVGDIANRGNISGSISITESLRGSLSPPIELRGRLYIPPLVGGEPYEGAYSVTPAFEKQTLETEGRVMEQDLDVEAIRISKTSNSSGGMTMYIGGI